MLIKWLFLLIAAWYIYRAAGNLIDAVLGRRERPSRIRPTDSTDSVNRSSAASENVSARTKSDDIEDARWKDI